MCVVVPPLAPRRREHNSVDSVRVLRERLQDRQGERRRLAAARLRRPNDVDARKHLLLISPGSVEVSALLKVVLRERGQKRHGSWGVTRRFSRIARLWDASGLHRRRRDDIHRLEICHLQ